MAPQILTFQGLVRRNDGQQLGVHGPSNNSN